eukprot:2113515-Pleurochrysis_carterae.AAC.6
MYVRLVALCASYCLLIEPAVLSLLVMADGGCTVVFVFFWQRSSHVASILRCCAALNKTIFVKAMLHTVVCGLVLNAVIGANASDQPSATVLCMPPRSASRLCDPVASNTACAHDPQDTKQLRACDD